jgi:site-specific recombinase XerC
VSDLSSARPWDADPDDDRGAPGGLDESQVSNVYTTGLRYVREKRQLREFARSTARVQCYVLAAFADAIGPELPVNRLSKRHVEKWLLARDAAPGTLRKELSIIRAFCTWCIEHDLLRKDPTRGIKGPRRQRGEPRAMTVEDVAAVLCETDLRGAVCILLMVQEGLRRAEVTSLTTDSVELDTMAVLVHGKGGHERWVPLSEETATAIGAYTNAYPAGPGSPLIRSYQFPWKPISPDHLTRLVDGWMKAAGVKKRPWDGKSSHAFRHSAARHILDNGGDLRAVQELLGHTHLSTTSVYTRRTQALGPVREAASGRQYGSVRAVGVKSPADA